VQRRAADFDKFVKDYAKNNLDSLIPGNRADSKTTSYLIEIGGIEGLKVPSVFGDDRNVQLGVQFHLSFFFVNKQTNQQFFFGRTVQTPTI